MPRPGGPSRGPADFHRSADEAESHNPSKAWRMRSSYRSMRWPHMCRSSSSGHAALEQQKPQQRSSATLPASPAATGSTDATAGAPVPGKLPPPSKLAAELSQRSIVGTASSALASLLAKEEASAPKWGCSALGT